MITGTFLDEISHDIPSANWGRAEWERDFQAMADFGIDTVILIRVGYRDRCAFPCKALQDRLGYLLVQEDLVGLFLELAERHGMAFFFGTYDSGEHWVNGDHEGEVEIGLRVVDEFFARHGHSPALQGWYISHEIDAFDASVMRVYERMAAHLKGLKDLPILISPYVHGAKMFDDGFTVAQHVEQWHRIFQRIEGHVDICAFQDGQVHYDTLPDFLAANAEMARAHGIQSWSNVESFDRDVHIKFPPIAWPKLRFKMEAARSAGVDKLITFEFSHFLSPHSMFPSTHGLHRFYREWRKGLDG